MIELYQFPFSPFCEKARWALEYKRITYRAVNLLPGFHFRRVGKLASKTCVPVLRDGEAVLQESSAIVDYLDLNYPTPSLTPRESQAAREAREWERYLDEEIGATFGTWLYYHLLPDRRRALNFFLQEAAWHERPLFSLGYPRLRQTLAQAMNANAHAAWRAEQRLRGALDALEETLEGRRFLVGGSFSRADLAACALLSPLCLPDDPKASAQFPAAVLRFRDELKGRPLFHWTRDVYGGNRRPPPLRAIPSLPLEIV